MKVVPFSLVELQVFLVTLMMANEILAHKPISDDDRIVMTIKQGNNGKIAVFYRLIIIDVLCSSIYFLVVITIKFSSLSSQHIEQGNSTKSNREASNQIKKEGSNEEVVED